MRVSRYKLSVPSMLWYLRCFVFKFFNQVDTGYIGYLRVVDKNVQVRFIAYTQEQGVKYLITTTLTKTFQLNGSLAEYNYLIKIK